MVSFKNAITPTELADFLIQKFHDFSTPIKRGEEIIVERSRRILGDEKIKFQNAIKYFRSVTNNRLMRSRNDIRRQSESLLQHSNFLIKRNYELLNWNSQTFKKALQLLMDSNKKNVEHTAARTKAASMSYMKNENDKLLHLEKNINILDPVNILKRGFSITLYDGKALKSHTDVKQGEKITTILLDGSIESEVITSTKSEQQ